MSIQMLVQTLVGAASLYILLRTLAVPASSKARYFLLLSLAAVFYALGYLLELDAHSLEAAYYAQRVQFYGISYFAAFYYLFIRNYGNRSVRGWWKIAALLVFPTIVMVLMNSYPDSRLVFESLSFELEPSPHLVVRSGVVHRLHIWYSFFLVALSLLEILLVYPKETPEQRRQQKVFFCATLLPNISIIVLAIDRLPVPMQFGSMSLVLSNAIQGYYILRHRAEDWLPYAREQIVQRLNDGYVLLDRSERLVDANPVAMAYFPALILGEPIRGVAGFPLEVLDPADDAAGDQEIGIHTGGEERYLSASKTPIVYQGEWVCTCVMFYDVTRPHQLMEELEQMATHDSLTGLLSRGTFFRLAARDLGLARRTDQPASLLMLDIDHFKRVNDRYGHQSGDAVLAGIARVLRERLRRTDISGRYGGEEFCVFLPSTNLAGALYMAEEIRVAVENAVFELNGGVRRVTVSIGAAELIRERHNGLDDLIADADAALYEAKRSGRNRVVAARKESATASESL